MEGGKDERRMRWRSERDVCWAEPGEVRSVRRRERSLLAAPELLLDEAGS
jgi:hypothetical protein